MMISAKWLELLQAEFDVIQSMPSEINPSEPANVYTPNPHADEGEDLENYRKGGFHPVDLQQIYGEGEDQYRIIHKLGHGGSSTVWVGQHLETHHLYALKFLSSSASKRSREVPKVSKLSRLVPFLSDVTTQLRDHFRVQGPNCPQRGKHDVLVMDLSGPSVDRLSYGETRMHRQHVQKVMLKTAIALQALHTAGVIHRDLTPRNVVLKLKPEVAKLSPNDFYATFGQPLSKTVTRTDRKDPLPNAPRHSYANIDFARARARALNEILLEPVLIDFGESTRRASLKSRAIPESYAAPEALIENRVSFSCDVWSLGCIIFRARSGHNLFPGSFMGHGDTENVLSQMAATLGLPPFSAWCNSEFDEDGLVIPSRQLRNRNSISTVKNELHWTEHPPIDDFPPLKERIRHIRDRPPGIASNKLFWGTGEQCAVNRNIREKYPRITEEEADILYDLLSRIFVWDPKRRISAAEIVKHPWFQYK